MGHEHRVFGDPERALMMVAAPGSSVPDCVEQREVLQSVSDLIVAALMFAQLPPTGWVAIASAVGLILGAGLGWQRGKMMHIHVDRKTNALNQKASPAAMFFLITLVIVRTGARGVIGQTSGVSPAMLTDPLIAFALGMFSVQRIEMYLRAKRLLEEARGQA